MSVSNSTNDDNSGLHDLKALASSTKQRRSQRLSSQMEAQDSLLQSAAGLEAVALPDPDKEQPISLAAVAIADAPLATAALAHESVSENLPAASIGTPPTSGSKILVVVGLAVLAAGAAAFYMMRGGGDSNTSDNVTAANAVVVPAEADEPAAAAEQAPVVEELAASADEIADEAATEDELSADDGIEDTADESASDSGSDAKVEASAAKNAKTTDKAPKAEKSEEAIARAEAKATAKEEAKAARELAKAEKLEAKAEKHAAASDKKAPTLGEGGASLDDVLSSVTGGVDKPIVDKKKDDTPTKKDLDRGDVAKAMKAITPAAKSCYAAEEFTGTVMVKYSVAPSGAMTKATAMGAHKNSKTGKCVLSAVKKASFPAFSGATQSFTFPFLLSP